MPYVHDNLIYTRYIIFYLVIVLFIMVLFRGLPNNGKFWSISQLVQVLYIIARGIEEQSTLDPV